MSYLFREINEKSWFDIPIREDDFPADPVTDLKTENNNLSVYLINNKDRDINVVITGLASNKIRIKKLAYMLIDVDEITAQGYEMQQNDGETPYQDANDLHWEIKGLTAQALVRLAKLFHSKTYQDTVPRPKVRDLLQIAVDNEKLNLRKMQRPLRDELKVDVSQ